MCVGNPYSYIILPWVKSARPTTQLRAFLSILNTVCGVQVPGTGRQESNRKLFSRWSWWRHKTAACASFNRSESWWPPIATRHLREPFGDCQQPLILPPSSDQQHTDRQPIAILAERYRDRRPTHDR